MADLNGRVVSAIAGGLLTLVLGIAANWGWAWVEPLVPTPRQKVADAGSVPPAIVKNQQERPMAFSLSNLKLRLDQIQSDGLGNAKEMLLVSRQLSILLLESVGALWGIIVIVRWPLQTKRAFERFYEWAYDDNEAIAVFWCACVSLLIIWYAGVLAEIDGFKALGKIFCFPFALAKWPVCSKESEA
jgi:hypothetical protein